MRTDATPERIRLLATDVDGVLTDGRIFLASDGTEMKAFHVRDGAGIKYAQRAGLTVAFITGRSSPLVELRASELGVTEIFQGAIDKHIPFEELLEKHEIEPGEVCYIGDVAGPSAKVQMPAELFERYLTAAEAAKEQP